MKERKKISYTIAAVLGFCGLVFLDQFTKYLASSGLKGRPPVVLIPDVLELQYLENRGAAFGSLQGMQGVSGSSRWRFWRRRFTLYTDPQNQALPSSHCLLRSAGSRRPGEFYRPGGKSVRDRFHILFCH